MYRASKILIFCFLLFTGSCAYKSPTPREHYPEIIKTKKENIRNCYNTLLKKHPEMRKGGKIVLAWDINASGVPSKFAKLEDTTKPEGVLFECMLPELKNMRFEPIEGSLIRRVQFPFVFTARDK